ncbi:MAG TPA: hypothetical protein VGC60_13340 [Pyrinomonadaceae bacterium]
MNEEPTRNLANPRSFEERVFARFDSIDARFGQIDQRFDTVDARLEKLESRNYDTKPIWERALAEITETRAQMNVRFGTLEKKVQAIETRVQSIETNVGTIATRVEVIEARVGAMESQLAALRSDFAGMRHELVDTQHEFKRTLTRLLGSLFSFLTDTRELMLDNDARLKQLESKLA